MCKLSTSPPRHRAAWRWHHCLLLCVSSKRSNQILHFKSGQIVEKSGKLCWNIFMSVWHVTRPRHCQLVLFGAELIGLPWLPSCHLLTLPMCNLQKYSPSLSARARPTFQNIRNQNCYSHDTFFPPFLIPLFYWLSYQQRISIGKSGVCPVSNKTE